MDKIKTIRYMDWGLELNRLYMDLMEHPRSQKIKDKIKLLEARRKLLKKML